MKKISKRMLEILAKKPEMVIDFPEWMLNKTTISKVKEMKDVAIAEIAGRDSFAAVIKACEIRTIKAIIPTVAYTGSEYGNWDDTFKKIQTLKDKLFKNGIKVFNTILLGSPEYWWKLCGRYLLHFQKIYGFYTPCTGCHLYFHTIRVPLAKKLKINLLIAGERELHDNRIKVNQIKIALDTYIDFLKSYDIELLLPIRHVNSGTDITSIIGEQWEEGKQQLECVLSKNYQEIDGRVILNEYSIRRFFNDFALKTSEEFVREHLD
ncbi:MAG: hypothetical protein HXY53_01600 [Nitrospirae bacterium]|nr:hypothetical protein [Nitrospirota bacterium]